MRRVITAGILITLVGGAAGCGGAATTPTPRSSAAVAPALRGFHSVTPGVLTVATNLPGPGYWDGNSPSTMHGGFEYGMAQYMAKALHLRLKIINVGWDGLVAGEVKGYDLALSTIDITPARQKAATFSIPYAESYQGVLVRRGTRVTAANARKLRWGVEQSSISYDYLTHVIKPAVAPHVYQDQPSMYAALEAHQIDAVLMDTTTILAEAKQAGGALQVVGQYHSGGVGTAYGALLPKGSPNVRIVNTLIRQMKANGTLERLDKKYLVPEFGQDPNAVPFLRP